MRMRLAILALSALLSSTVATHAQERKDYLSDTEADKIREATTPSAKMVLFVTFADDRIAKLKYTLAHPSTDRRRSEQLNALINAYTGCIDDAADVIAVARERQQDIKVGLKALTTRAKEDLAYVGFGRSRYQVHSVVEDTAVNQGALGPTFSGPDVTKHIKLSPC